MMVERHYDDEALIALLETNRIRSDAHLPSCTGCSEKLHAFRTISGALRDHAVWDSRPLHGDAVSSTVATLRAFADRMADDDARAALWLRELLAGPRQSWMPRLRQHPEYRTAGVVRKLVDAAERAIDSVPPDAVELSALATEIADHLDPEAHPSDTVSRLRGAAWRTRAFGLFYTGEYGEAEKAVRLADAHFRGCVVNEYDRARVGVVESLIARARDSYDVAVTRAQASANVFDTHGDLGRYVSARSSEAAAIAHAGRYADALELWLALEETFSRDDASDAHARLLGNVGYAYRNLGNVELSLKYYGLAAELFELAGTETEAARVRWNVAAMLLEHGRFADAGARLEPLRATFTRLGMPSEAALVALDLAEVRLLQHRAAEVPELCNAAVATFEAAGVTYTARAQRAIAYIREAAAADRATRQLVRHVREYVRRLPAEPALLFAPPPPELG